MQYRILKAGEIIELGDEYDAVRDPWRDEARWVTVTKNLPTLGQAAPDPRYPAHTLYRRPIKPAESGKGE